MWTGGRKRRRRKENLLSAAFGGGLERKFIRKEKGRLGRGEGDWGDIGNQEEEKA